MAATETPTLAEAEKNATIGRFLYRQLFLTVPPPPAISLTGKTAIVTGANTGLGLEIARQLLDHGLSKLILAVRDEVKGQNARAELLSGRDSSDLSIEVWQLDMLSYESITTFVERIKGLPSLDIAVLNAGVMKQIYTTSSSTGHEDTTQVNFLSTALLAILLLPILNPKSKSKPNELGCLVWV